MRTFEDFTAEATFALPSQPVTRADIIAFAAEFDPQPFHLAEPPPDAMVGGLIASGWHVCAILMRMLCDGLLLDSTCLGSPGIDTLKWLRPVRAGDTLSGRVTVLAARTSASRPERGIVRFRHELFNQASEPVLVMENPILFGRRAP